MKGVSVQEIGQKIDREEKRACVCECEKREACGVCRQHRPDSIREETADVRGCVTKRRHV